MFKITTTEDGRALITTPYNATFVSRIKKIGGAKWDSSVKAWNIPEAEIETAREYMLDVYGETDLPDDTERFPVRVTFHEDVESIRDSIVLFGKTIARAKGRDSGAFLGEDVTFENGSPTSGGSSQYWKTIIPKGCIVKIRNVNRIAFETEADNESWTAVIVNETAINRESLIAERKKILARLREIDALLGTEQTTDSKPKPKRKSKKKG